MPPKCTSPSQYPRWVLIRRNQGCACPGARAHLRCRKHEAARIANYCPLLLVVEVGVAVEGPDGEGRQPCCVIRSQNKAECEAGRHLVHRRYSEKKVGSGRKRSMGLSNNATGGPHVHIHLPGGKMSARAEPGRQRTRRHGAGRRSRVYGTPGSVDTGSRDRNASFSGRCASEGLSR